MEKKQMYRLVNPNQDIEFDKRMQTELKDPEDRIYLVCLRTDNNDMWELCNGRSDAYTYIRDALDSTNVDLRQSFILVENCKLYDRKTIYEFLKHIQAMYEDGFDIDEYIRENSIEYDTHVEDIEPMIDNSQIITMSQLMGKDINLESLE